MTVENAWDTLMELGVTEQTLQIVSNINGYSLETLEDVLFAHAGYRDFSQPECQVCSGTTLEDDGSYCPECYA